MGKNNKEAILGVQNSFSMESLNFGSINNIIIREFINVLVLIIS
jgi:hypothetical protein